MIVGMLENGIPLSTIATVIENGRRTIQVEMVRDLKFAAAVKRARLVFEDHCLTQIRLASKKTWTAAAWLLERRYPAKYARATRHLPVHESLKVDLTNGAAPPPPAPLTPPSP